MICARHKVTIFALYNLICIIFKLQEIGIVVWKFPSDTIIVSNFHILHINQIYKIINFVLPDLNLGKICNKPLLQKQTDFPDHVFSGSFPSNNSKEARITGKGWCAPPGSYLLIDLQREYHITQVVTMGRETGIDSLWSKSYSLKYSHDKALVDRKRSVQVCLNIPNNAKNSRKINMVQDTQYTRMLSCAVYGKILIPYLKTTTFVAFNAHAAVANAWPMPTLCIWPIIW